MRTVAFLFLLVYFSSGLAVARLPADAQETPRRPTLTPGGHIPLRNVEVLSDTSGLDLTAYLRPNVHFVQHSWRKLTMANVIGSSHAASDLAVEFTVSRDGSLSGAKLTQSSGDNVLDDAALGALRDASPFQELPPNYGGQSLALRVQLHYNPNLVAPLEHPRSASQGSAEREHAGRAPVAKAIFTPNPEFSEEARSKHVEGTVALRLTVSESGDVSDAVVTKGLGYGLDEKALEAVRRWKFEPPLKDGQPISTTADVIISFHLAGEAKH